MLISNPFVKEIERLRALFSYLCISAVFPNRNRLDTHRYAVITKLKRISPFLKGPVQGASY